MGFIRALKAKLHMAAVTDADLMYEGSITIDSELMDMAGIKPYEFLLISNVNNGERFETYVIPGKPGSREVCLNGATARKGLRGDRIIIFSIAFVTPEEMEGWKPKIIVLSDKNEPLQVL